MIQAAYWWLKTAFKKDKVKCLPSVSCAYADRFENIDRELSRVSNQLGELREELKKLIDRG